MLRQFGLHDPVHVGCLDDPVLLDQMERQIAKREMVRFQRKAGWSGILAMEPWWWCRIARSGGGHRLTSLGMTMNRAASCPASLATFLSSAGVFVLVFMHTVARLFYSDIAKS